MNSDQNNSNITQESDKNSENEKEEISQKNKDLNLFSFLPKEILEEIDISESQKNPNYFKQFGNYDIPEFKNKIPKSGEMYHQSPDTKNKSKYTHQKQNKRPFIGLYSNSDNNLNNINILQNLQIPFNQNKTNNFEQWNYQNRLVNKKYSGNPLLQNEDQNKIYNRSRLFLRNSINNQNDIRQTSFSGNQLNIYNTINEMNNMNINQINNMNKINSANNINNMNNMNNNNSVNAMANLSMSPISNNNQQFTDRINPVSNISQMLNLSSNDFQKKNYLSSSNLQYLYPGNNIINHHKPYYTDKNLNRYAFPFNLYNNNFIPNIPEPQNNIQNLLLNFQNNKNSDIELNDSQIDFLFSQLCNLPKGVCLILYLIDQITVPYFIKLLKTIKGSKYMQNLLITNPPKESEIDYITKIICNNYKEIMCDYYGNYFLQKFLLFCSLKNRLDIYEAIKKEYIEIANDICGNHSLQCLIGLQSSDEEKEIIKKYIKNNIKILSFGCNSSHVVSKVISSTKESEREYINNFIMDNLMELCIDPNSICIIKEFIANTKNNTYIKLIISCFEKETEKLTQHQFGNFVIQEAIKVFGFNYCKKIVKKIIKNIVSFSVSKFSSNVIDFLLEYLSKNDFIKFCQVLKDIFLNENNFKEMIKNKFSIYVIENSLDLLIKINENYFDFASRNTVNLNRNESDSSDSSDSEEELVYETFCKLKKQIFQLLENNSAAKEKKKILTLIKAYKSKNV